MREKICNAIGFMLLGSLLILLSGATGDPLTSYDPANTIQVAELVK